MKNKLRVISLALALLLILTALSGCANAEAKPNADGDGEIGTKKESRDSEWSAEGIDDVEYYTAEDIVYSSKSSAKIATEGSSTVIKDYSGCLIEDMPEGGDSANQYSAGTLTGAEWCDNDHWKDFTSHLEGQDASTADWMEIAEKWHIVATKRLAIHVTNGEKAVALATAELLDGNGKTLWTAVTDNAGDAYLFWNTDPSAQSATPVSVRVTAKSGETTTTALDGVNLNETLPISLNAENGKVKLDLMLMIDTTGSMGDELEYLKVELEDVVKRVKTDCQISVRTSVNFYRDEGDDYVVRYFGFKDNLDDAIANIQAQSSDGGGDYAEAVHTALDNAVNGHDWNEDSVKLLVLVLDAPPHEGSDVIQSLNQTIAQAAAMGIRIIPVASSGVDTECQVLFRSWAAMTGGTYTYLTDDSGIGESHDKPKVEEETVEYLNDMLVRIISGYCTVQ